MTVAPTKTRSPNYPAISLSEAATRVRTIYSKQQRYMANRDVLAQHLGYGGVNGASATIISALSKYGLIEGYGDKLRVSELGQDLALHQAGDAEYTAALRQAAFTPTLFQELRDQYPHGLPDDRVVRNALIKRGFNPKSVDGVIRAYRDTIEFVDAETGGAVANLPDEEPAEGAMQTQQTSRSGAPPSADPGIDAILRTPQGQTLLLQFKLAEDSEASVAFKGHVTQEAVEKLIKFLDLSLDTFPKKGPAKATPAAPATTAPNESGPV